MDIGVIDLSHRLFEPFVPVFSNRVELAVGG